MADDPEIKRILGQILGALQITGEGSASQLVLEVREALRGRGEPTVSSTIRDFKTTMSHEFQILRDHLNNTGGRGSGGTAPPRDGGGGHDAAFQARLVQLLSSMDEVLARLERATVSFEEMGHGSGGGGSGGPRSFYEREILLNTTKIVQDLVVAGASAKQTFEAFTGLVKSQTLASLEAMARSVFEVGLNLTNLGSQFRNLRTVLGKEIGELQSGGVFGSNVLGPSEFFLEGPKRAMDGVLFETDSFRTALKLAHSAIQDDMVSPLSLTGKSVTELAADFHKARQDMREQFHFDSRGWMGTDETNKAIYSMMEFQRRTGIQTLNAQVDAERNTAQELNYLKVIATMTGQTVTQLEQQTQANRRQQEILVGMGRMTGDEAAMSARIQTGLENRLGKSASQGLMDTLHQITGYGRDQGQILANPAVPQEFKNLFATMPETMRQLIQINNERMMKLAPGENEDSRTNRIIQEISALGPSLQRFTSMGRSDVPSQVAIFGAMQETLSRLKIAANVAGGLQPPDKAQLATRDQSEVYSFIQMMKEWWREQISPFIGLPSVIAANTIAIIANTAALLGRGGILSALGGLGGGGAAAAAAGGGTIASRVAGGLTRAAPVLGGLGGAAAAYMEGSSTAGVAGAGLGGAGGAYGGAILGTAIAGPVGTVIGGILGSFLGSWLGQKTGEGIQSPTKPAQTSEDASKIVAGYQQQAAAAAAIPPTAASQVSVPSAGDIANATFERFRPYMEMIGKQTIVQGSSPNINVPSADNVADAVFIRFRPYLERTMMVAPGSPIPPVSPPANVFGPQAAEVAASTNSTYQDSNISLLTQIVQTGAQGNYILGQMYGELSRQTGYLRGDPNGAGGGISYNGQGLAANVAPVVTGTRPSDSNPYVGPGA